MAETQHLEALAVGLSRAEASRVADVLRFPDRPIVVIPHDPIAHATGAIKTAADDFMFAISEAFNAGDVEGLAALQEHIGNCVEAIAVVKSMAADFKGRMEKK